MSEQEAMDRLLRRVLAAEQPPALSSTFDQRLAKRFRPRRPSRSGRVVLTLYALAALILSTWTMRSESLGWDVIALAVALQLAVAAALHHRRFRLSRFLNV